MARTGGSKAPAGTALTRAELKVLNGLAEGKNLSAVAKMIGCSENTVKTHTLNIKSRTNTHSMGAAVAVAVARGEIVVPAEPGEELPWTQQQILIGFAQARSTTQIAEKLCLSVQKVKRETTALYHNLNGVSRPHLVYLGLKTGNLTINRRKSSE